ncbi:Ba167 [Baboon cytomegalovirus]|nr:Ba167 [Baboon cytomegalovirus]
MDMVFIVLVVVGAIFVAIMTLAMFCYPMYVILVCYNFFSCPWLGAIFSKCCRKKNGRVWPDDFKRSGARSKQRLYRDQANDVLIDIDNVNDLKAKTKMKTKTKSKKPKSKALKASSGNETEKLLDSNRDDTGTERESQSSDDSVFSDDNGVPSSLQSVAVTQPRMKH